MGVESTRIHGSGGGRGHGSQKSTLLKVESDDFGSGADKQEVAGGPLVLKVAAVPRYS